MLIDPTTPIGKLRLRVGDYSDFPIMPDEVYTAVLDDNTGDIKKSTVEIAQYILAALTGQTQQRLGQIEIYGGEWFKNYLQMLKTTILNPNYMDMHPVPYTPIIVDAYGNQLEMPLIQFQKDWNNNFVNGTEAEQTRMTALTPQGTPSYF